MSIRERIKKWQEKNGAARCPEVAERRQFPRLVYARGERPILKIRDCELEVLDISEKGLKLLNIRQERLGDKIHGTIVFLSGRTVPVTGTIVWQQKKELGVLVSDISPSVVQEEVRALLGRIS